MANNELKQTLVPDAKGCIRIAGYEDKAKEFQTSFRYYKKLDGEISKVKDEFRELAEHALFVAAPGVKRVEFMSGDGAGVPVTVPDYSKMCNRNTVDDKKLGEIIAATGVDLKALNILADDEQYILTGEFVSWFKKILDDNYTSKGIPIPSGIEYKNVTKLSNEGLAKLEKMARGGASESEQEAAKRLLKTGRKAPTVSGS